MNPAITCMMSKVIFKRQNLKQQKLFLSSTNQTIFKIRNFFNHFHFQIVHLVFSNTVAQMGPQLIDFHNQWALFLSFVKYVVQNGTKLEPK